MKRISFKAIPGCTGRLVSNIELKIYHHNLDELKSKLRANNTSAAWKLKREKDSRGYYQNRLNHLDACNEPNDSDTYLEVRNKLAVCDDNIKQLEDELVETFFLENDDGSLSVPSGFWYLCEKIENNYHLNRELPAFKLPGLRPYQIEALDALYKYRRGTVELATGLGKSKIIMSAALSGVKAKKRVMIIVPTEYLVGQMFNELKDLHQNTTALGGDFKHVKLGWDIIVTTMASAPKYVDMATMLIIDEGHHAPASTWAELLSNAENATHVYNFTATAFRSDGLDLAIHSFGGPIVYQRDARWGIDNNWLSPLSVAQIRIHPRDDQGAKIFLPDHMQAQNAYKKLVSQSNVLDLIKEKTLLGVSKNKKQMLIFKTVKMAEYFQKYIKTELKFQVAHADKSKTKNPKYPLHQFRKGETDLLVACVNLVAEGIDIVNSDYLLMVTNHSGDITTYQLIGRVLRKAPGKTKAVVFDIAVMGYKQFEGAADKRLAVYQKLTDNVVVINL